MRAKWRGYAYQVRGKSHELDGIPGEDRVRFVFRNGVKVLCLADGAGSARYSADGAEAVVDAGCEFAIANFGSGTGASRIVDVDALHAQLIARLNGTASRLACGLKDLASTFLCVVITEDFFVAVHIGDGSIGAQRNGQLEVLTQPDNGDFANVTTFVTSKNAVASAQVVSGDIKDYSGFILMSDWTADSLYDYDLGSLARACRTLLRILADAPTYEVANPAYKKELKQIMDLQIRARTDDDCSIGMLAR